MFKLVVLLFCFFFWIYTQELNFLVIMQTYYMHVYVYFFHTNPFLHWNKHLSTLPPPIIPSFYVILTSSSSCTSILLSLTLQRISPIGMWVLHPQNSSTISYPSSPELSTPEAQFDFGGQNQSVPGRQMSRGHLGKQLWSPRYLKYGLEVSGRGAGQRGRGHL